MLKKINITALASMLVLAQTTQALAVSKGGIYSAESCIGSYESNSSRTDFQCDAVRILDNEIDPQNYAEFRFTIAGNSNKLSFIGVNGGVKTNEYGTGTALRGLVISQSGKPDATLNGQGTCLQSPTSIGCILTGEFADGGGSFKIQFEARAPKLERNVTTN
jgi:hypothetical protein